ncbi:hypothetical protein K458DRAFT_45379 [Lentithecium fluviatile CBS 122367]|uniref:Rhodopsin domain-containing protein n=1 Tax=Lentithecium fluviatile CBS 122367 TaxID=1168545 RepID=A0A6G1IZK4_9PLEO|nr:hypothetical protein K458DRAFT_45379 [Lentithecium fluviatile CBS 122367]
MAASQSYPNRSGTAKGINITASIVMTFFAIWRLIVRFRINPRMGWSDYWIILALITALTGHTWLLVSAFSGEGRVDADPYVTFEVRNRVFFLQHIGGALNMYAMFFAKLSICAYLLALNFSRAYRYIIISSIVLICICNFTLPMLSHWAACTPVSARWDRSFKPDEKKCWPFIVHTYITYIQSTTNVLTDILYAAAPIIYLRQVQLSTYTQWGVRLVFLAALFGTGVSIAKPIHFAQLQKTFYGIPNFLYISVTTTSLSTAENSICIIVACLPPLRRTIDNLLKRTLPQSILEALGATETPSRSFTLPTFYTNQSQTADSKFGSERESTAAILGNEEFVEDASGKIVKTTRVTVTREFKDSVEFGRDGQSPTVDRICP